MTRSSRPYLARALYEWLLDNELTPYLVVDATRPGVEVPEQLVQNGQIVLNASPTAVRDFFMENQAIGFSARFSGKPMQIMIPMEALIAVYARENAAGMVFGHEPDLATLDEEASDEASPGDDDARAPALTSVSDSGDGAQKGEKDEETSSDRAGDKSEETGKKDTGKKRPSLRVVK
ncbi:ClpXP protease specificity-enhancing factor [Halomonas piscis]|uniref:ClpXP protease specificity-enhancing factor n=1 Tax=Halomonas piscis TaxID=3031727 RepID=A0ABY9Z344_9GAMM|nr:ClpXP protease specificity-enhancing factor [Halomonas piscis]WNK21416.1 ClpXP protease specificity-enhancing factor [Halomonas piscis]